MTSRAKKDVKLRNRLWDQLPDVLADRVQINFRNKHSVKVTLWAHGTKVVFAETTSRQGFPKEELVNRLLLLA